MGDKLHSSSSSSKGLLLFLGRSVILFQCSTPNGLAKQCMRVGRGTSLIEACQQVLYNFQFGKGHGGPEAGMPHCIFMLADWCGCCSGGRHLEAAAGVPSQQQLSGLEDVTYLSMLCACEHVVCL